MYVFLIRVIVEGASIVLWTIDPQASGQGWFVDLVVEDEVVVDHAADEEVEEQIVG